MALRFNPDALTFGRISAIIHQGTCLSRKLRHLTATDIRRCLAYFILYIIPIGENREFRKFEKRFGKI